MEQVSGILWHLETELVQTRGQGRGVAAPRGAAPREAAPDPGVWSSAEHQGQATGQDCTNHHLLEEGEDFDLGDTLDGNSMRSVQKTSTYQIVDGNVVSEVNDTEVLRH